MNQGQRRVAPGVTLAVTALALLITVVGPSEAGKPTEASLFDLSEALGFYESSARTQALRGAAEGSIDIQADTPFLVEEVIRRSYARGFTDQELLILLQRTESLAGANLPVTPVLSRYLEGIAKGVPFTLIDQVSAGLEHLLREAGGEVDAGYPVPEDDLAKQARLALIDLGAYALDLGVSAELLDRSMAMATTEHRPHEQGVSPVLALGIMVGSGITPDRSAHLVDLAWNNGYRGDALERLGKGLGRVAQEPGAVDQVIQMIDDGASQDRVFEGLDEIVGRGAEMLRLPGNPSEDPSVRRGRGPTDDPINQPRRNQERPGVTGGGV